MIGLCYIDTSENEIGISKNDINVIFVLKRINPTQMKITIVRMFVSRIKRRDIPSYLLGRLSWKVFCMF